MAFVVEEVAMELVEALKPLVWRIKGQDRSLADQVSRACTSVFLNVAESNYSDPGNRRARLFTAAGSANEVRAGLRVAVAWHYLRREETAAARELLDRVIAMLWRLTRGWSQSRDRLRLSEREKMAPEYPPAVAPEKVGTYPALAKSGGGYVWDAVLEYRVWCYPREGAEHFDGGNDYFYAFGTFAEASEFARTTVGAQEPLALILQEEYIAEPTEGEYIHVKSPRVTEWPVEFLSRPKRTESTIPDFLSPSAPPNRLDIIRGKAKLRLVRGSE